MADSIDCRLQSGMNRNDRIVCAWEICRRHGHDGLGGGVCDLCAPIPRWAVSFDHGWEFCSVVQSEYRRILNNIEAEKRSLQKQIEESDRQYVEGIVKEIKP